MTKNLPIPLNDTYVEPQSWTMPGLAFVRFVTPQEKMLAQYAGCTLVAENSDGDVLAAFGSVADAVIALAGESCHIRWSLIYRDFGRGELALA